MDTERTYQKTEEKKDILKAPLLDGQKHIVYSMIEDKNVAEDVINIIEHTIRSSDNDNKFDIIVEALSPLIQNKAKLVVGKLYIYKRRPCRFNNNCKDENCIFTHEKDNMMNNSYKKRKLEEIPKRSNFQNSSKSNEVVFNKVDSSKYTEDDIKKYASEFGSVSYVKKLNESKWVIVFDSEESAKNIVESRIPVLGDENIKKYFNLVENLKKFELVSLIEKTEVLINKLEKNVISEEIRRNVSKIKNLVKEESTATKENNKTKINVQSLYFNSF